MKILAVLILGLTMAACTSTTPDKSERMSREPVKYWNYVEAENTFVEDTEEDEGIYYWNYRGDE